MCKRSPRAVGVRVDRWRTARPALLRHFRCSVGRPLLGQSRPIVVGSGARRIGVSRRGRPGAGCSPAGPLLDRRYERVLHHLRRARVAGREITGLVMTTRSHSSTPSRPEPRTDPPTTARTRRDLVQRHAILPPHNRGRPPCVHPLACGRVRADASVRRGWSAGCAIGMHR